MVGTPALASQPTYGAGSQPRIGSPEAGEKARTARMSAERRAATWSARVAV